MNALIQTALLGTEKKSLDVQSLPQPIQELLGDYAREDAEQQMLQAISLVTFFNAAGTMPPKLARPADENIISETQPVAPDDLLQLFGKFELVEYQIREALVSDWLQVLAKRNEIVSPELVVTLIQFGKNMTNHTRAQITDVIGNKGRWILQYDASLNYSAVTAEDQRWNEGTTADRKQIFTTWRKTDRVKAWKHLNEVWETEPIASKKMFLEIIGETLAADDIPSLEVLYQEEFAYRAKEKKTEKECRRILASMLLRVNTTKLYQHTTTQLQNYVVKERKGLLGLVTGKEPVSIRLPEAEDAFWNASLMEQQYGFEVKTYDIARFNTIIQFWMAHFLRYLPMSFWVQAFDGDYHRTLHYWLTHAAYQIKIEGAKVSIFLEALVDHVKQHQDSKTAFALITLADDGSRPELSPYMTLADFETYVSQNNLFGYEHVLQHGPYAAGLSWSPAFSEKVIATAFESAMKNQSSAQVGKLIAQHAHPASLQVLFAYNAKAHDTVGYHNWNTHIFQIAQPAFEIRAKIKHYTN